MIGHINNFNRDVVMTLMSSLSELSRGPDGLSAQKSSSVGISRFLILRKSSVHCLPLRKLQPHKQGG